MSSNDRYEIFESLGENDYLTVFRGWDRRLRRYVAIMELERRFRVNRQQFESVWDEILSFASIEHFGLVRVYEVDKECGWIVTELMKGSLASRISNSTLSSIEVRSVLRTGLEALGYLHERNKLHGDIRPANLLIDDEGHVRLSHPVGLAVGGQIPRRTMNQKYLAPELVKPEFGEPGPSTDLYCLGFSAYELLLGPQFEGLFKGVNDRTGMVSTAGLGWLRWHTSDDASLPPLKEVRQDVSDDVAETIDRLVSKQVKARPVNAMEALGFLSESESEEIVFAMDNTDLPSERTAATGRAERSSLSRRRGETNISSPAGRKPHESRTREIPRERSQVRTGCSAQALRKTWIEEKLKNPWVFRSLAAAVLVIAAFVGFALRPNGGDEPDATALAERAKQKLAEGDYQDAIKDVEEAMKLDPSRAKSWNDIAYTAYLSRGRLSLEKQTYPQAVEDFSAAGRYATSPDQDGSARGYRGIANGRHKQLDASIQDFEHALKVYPDGERTWSTDACNVYRERGNQRYDNKDYAAAESDLQRAINLIPEDDHALVLLAASQYHLHNYDSASTNFVHALDSSPELLREWGTMASDSLFRRGNDRKAAKDYNAAIADFSAALGLQPNSTETLTARASAFQETGQWQLAVADFTSLIDRQEELPKSRALRAICYLKLDMLDRAITDYECALEQGYHFEDEQRVPLVEAFLHRADTRLVNKEYDHAISDYSTALQIDETNAQALMSRAKAFAAIGSIDRAIDDLNLALSYQPDSVRLYVERSRLLLQLAKYDAAIADVETAEKLAPDRSDCWRQAAIEAYSSRGSFFLKQNNYTSAAEDFSSVLLHDKEDCTALMSRGQAWAATSQHEEAIDDFSAVIDLTQDVTDDSLHKDVLRIAVFGRGKSLLELGRYKEARRDFDTLIGSKHGDFAMAYIKRGIVLEQLTLHQNALDDFSQALALDPTSYAALNNRGVCYLQLGQYDEAITDFDRATRIDEKFPNAYYNRYIAYAQEGLADQAKDDLTRARSLESRTSR